MSIIKREICYRHVIFFIYNALYWLIHSLKSTPKSPGYPHQAVYILEREREKTKTESVKSQK